MATGEVFGGLFFGVPLIFLGWEYFLGWHSYAKTVVYLCHGDEEG
jgi:hypothetical protein